MKNWKGTTGELLERYNEAVEAIETTIIGMEWNAENEPITFSKSDYQHLGNLRELIKKHESC